MSALVLLAQAQESGSAWSLLQNTQLVFWGSIMLICVIPPLAHYWWKIRKMETEAGLKQEMIQKGMSAEDIERVLNAGKRGKCDD